MAYKDFEKKLKFIKSSAEEIVASIDFLDDEYREVELERDGFKEDLDEHEASIVLDHTNLREKNIAEGLERIMDWVKDGFIPYEKIETIIQKSEEYVQKGKH